MTPCQVWWARTDDVRCEHDLLLAPDDLTRRARFRRPDDRRRATAGAAVLRLVLGGLLGVAPADLAIDRTCRECGAPHGKPRLPGGPEFSVAHAGGCVVVAVAEGTPVGVDVEEVGRFRHGLEALAGAILAAEERAAQPLTPEVLATYWTRKEAVVKATGEGLAGGPDRVLVTPPSSPPGVLRGPASSLADLCAPPGLVGALAVLGSPVRVAEHDAGPLLAQSSRRLLSATTRSHR